MKPLYLPPGVKPADYKEQSTERYRGNKLIEALPLPQTEDELLESLKFLPEFDKTIRDQPAHARIHELLGLTNFMVPMTSHIQLAQTLDTMMRQGYVGRRPLSREHIAIFQDIRDDELANGRKKGPFRQTADTITTQLSTALIGVSGMGKTSTVRRALAHIDRVIYHPELDILQIPYIHFEMPSDGKGVKALYAGIIQQFDELLPEKNYYYDFVVKGRPSAPAMGYSVRKLLNQHCVGILIADELQNISKTRAPDRQVMTEMTTLSNSKAPVMWIGTNKAASVLGEDLSIGRRGGSLGLGDWQALPRKEQGYAEDGSAALVDGEWASFMRVMWKYQWVRTPVKLTDSMMDLFFKYTQGIIDLAIKLFVVSQSRAIVDGSETLSEQLVSAVYEHDMRLVHPMVDALRNNDVEALIRFEDIKPITAEDMVTDLERRYRGKRMPAASARPGTSDFEHRLVSAAGALGIPTEDAVALAKKISEDGTAKNMYDAAQQLGKLMQVPKPRSASKGAKAKADAIPAYRNLAERPFDYRNAIVSARTENTTIAEQLLRLDMVPDPEEVVCIA